jgi:hypothetical protein
MLLAFYSLLAHLLAPLSVMGNQAPGAAAGMERRRLVFLGLGDTALYTIAQLYDSAVKLRIEIVCVTPRPAMDSGQDVGLRLTNLALMREYGKSVVLALTLEFLLFLCCWYDVLTLF